MVGEDIQDVHNWQTTVFLFTSTSYNQVADGPHRGVGIVGNGHFLSLISDCHTTISLLQVLSFLQPPARTRHWLMLVMKNLVECVGNRVKISDIANSFM